MGWEYDERRESVHVPKDAGEYTDRHVKIMMRIPDGWGRWISCDRGWYPIIIGVDRRLAELDPNYTVHQVKEKFDGLWYYYEPTDSVDGTALRKMSEIVAEAEAEAEAEVAGETCERCGSVEQVEVRMDLFLVLPMCDECEAKWQER